VSSVPADLTIRPSRRDELGAVLDLWAENRSPHVSIPDDIRVLERLLDSDPGSLLVAESSGRVIGALIAAWDGWRGNMYRLAVGHEHRRRSVALELVRAGEQHLHARGGRRITALVGDEDEVAKALWSAAGYEHDRSIARFVRNL
jgi:ribosomal protein S18 acetylase RimI-like enzyme